MFDGINTKPWFRDDLLKILIGINLASRAHLPKCQEDLDFRRGFVHALACIAISIDIHPDRILNSDDLALLQSSISGELTK